MKSDFLLAITQLSAEKNLPKDVVLAAVELALVSAYRKDNFAPNQNLTVKINSSNGGVQVWAEKTVMENPVDSRTDVSLKEARQVKKDAQLGDLVMIESTPQNAGRIAAQTAKQVILQRLHEAEHSAIMEEFANREGEIVTGLIQRIEPRQIFIDLGRTEAVMPVTEQVTSEHYRVGQRLKVVILEVVKTTRGPRVIVSRSHPDLPRRLFEMEVPEIYNGTVSIKSIAREAGSRSKVAVGANQEGVDPVGCCVGLRGIRIQNIVNELNGEKIDVVMWSPEIGTFIANALSPAHIVGVELDRTQGVATAVVPDRQLSLAIGKEGQNVRLAAKLTGWRIDIKSVSVAETEKAARMAAEAEAALLNPPPAKAEAEVTTGEKVSVTAEEGEPVVMPFIPPVLEPAGVKKKELRFAEDILAPPAAQTPVKTKKKAKKKSSVERTTREDAVGIKKGRRDKDIDITGTDEEF